VGRAFGAAALDARSSLRKVHRVVQQTNVQHPADPAHPVFVHQDFPLQNVSQRSTEVLRPFKSHHAAFHFDRF